MGIGIAAGPKAVVEAAKLAVSSPLLDEVSLSGASSVLVSITAASDVSIFSVNEAVSMIEEEDYSVVKVVEKIAKPNQTITIQMTDTMYGNSKFEFNT